MRAFFLIVILVVASLNCKSKLEKGSVVKSVQNPKIIQGAWHLYDAESNSLVGKGPIFELAAQQKFYDTAAILCHFSKLQTGDLLDLIRRHADSKPTGEKLKNCPDYSYEGDIQGVQIFSSPEHNEAPMVVINFADLKKMAKFRNGQSGQLYYLYIEMKHSPQMMGAIGFSPHKAQVNRLPVALVRSP
jgi:hypothetical protein